MSVYKLYGSTGVAADGLASLDVQFDGHIVAYSIHAYASGMDASGEGYQIEASFLSTSAITSNDARGLIGMAVAQSGMLTSGGSQPAVNHSCSGLSIPVTGGERLYLHVGYLSTPGTVKASVVLYVEDSADANLRRRR